MNRSLSWLTLLCALLILSCATVARADYGAGQAAWKAGRYAEAMKEWRAAARQGDKRAMVALGRAFVKGVGVPQDFVEAHKWLNLAAARGDAKAAAERDAIEKRMTLDEQAEARKLARAWRTTGGRRSTAIPPRRRAPGTPRPPRRMARKASPGSAALRAAAAGNISALEKALAAGANPNARGRRGWTPLMYAADKGFTLLVPPLLKAGAKPNLRAADGATALFIAALHGHSGIVELLMKAGADPTIKGPKDRTAEEAGYLGKNPRIIEALGLVKTIRESNGMAWKGAVLGGKKHGRWTKTRADGAIVEEGPYVKGKKHGRWKETHRDRIELGPLFREKNPSVYMRNDERLETGPYVEGERHGGWTLSAYHGGKLQFKLEGPYVKGRKHGRWKVLAGKSRWEGSYARGKRDGLWSYSFVGFESATYYYRKGKRHGPCTWEYRSRQSWGSLTQTLRTAYVDDLMHGPYMYESNYRYWSGRTETHYEYDKGMYVKGKKHGKWLIKRRDNRGKTNINFSEEHYYENGRIIRKPSLKQETAAGENDEAEEQHEGN